MNQRNKAGLAGTRAFLLALGMAAAVPCLAQQPPSISTQPQSQTNWFGTTATFTVKATGAEPLAYQWQRDTGFLDFWDLAGCTATNLCLTNVQASDGVNYRIIVTNAFGSVTSSVASLTVLVPPRIISVRNVYPLSSLGSQQALRVTASGTPPPSFQWVKDGAALAGQTNYLLNFPSTQLADLGFYTVVATNLAGAVTSSPVRLDVDTITFTKITQGPVATDTGSSWGCGWADFDSDGLLDLGVALESGAVRFYHNLGSGSFSRTEEPVPGWLASLSWGDFDNDGYPDCLVPGWDSPNALLRSNGDGTFTRAAAGDLVAGQTRVFPGGWADYDNDGYLDAFLGVGGGGQALYRNKGDGTFTRITNSSLVTIVAGSPQGIAWGDYNNDGRPDVFISAGYNNGNNLLFRNDGGGQFTPITGVAPVTAGSGYWDNASWGDYDNDGDLDLFVNKWGPGEFFRNNGDGTFTRLITGIPQESGDGAVWGDYDNDGYLDLFLAKQGGVNAFYRNNGDGTFTKRSGTPTVDSSTSITPAWGDYDNDGFLDLFVANSGGGNNFLYHNNGNSNHWLKVKLVGTVSNRAAIGAKVRVRATIQGKTMWQMREVNVGSGIGGSELNPHFGLGDATTAQTVRIEWPSGAVQELKNVSAGQFLTVTEPARLETVGAGQFRIRSWKGMAFTVEASPDLETWSPVSTVTNLTGTLTFADPAPGNSPQRFYRVKSK